MLKCEQKTMLIQILSFTIVRMGPLSECYNSDYPFDIFIGMMCEMFCLWINDKVLCRYWFFEFFKYLCIWIIV